MVESQHIAATMKLVDNRDEQDLLESLLESSKPAQPDDTAGLDYLLATAFRYDPKRGGWRFRATTDPGACSMALKRSGRLAQSWVTGVGRFSRTPST